MNQEGKEIKQQAILGRGGVVGYRLGEGKNLCDRRRCVHREEACDVAIGTTGRRSHAKDLWQRAQKWSY